MMRSLWAPPEASKKDSGIRVHPAYLVERSDEYERRRNEKGEKTGEGPTPGVGEPVRWTPPHPDIQDPAELYNYLSPEVRRFAVAMEARLREPGGGATLPSHRDGRPADDRAHQTPEHQRPMMVYNRMLAESRALLEAVRHYGVCDRMVRPLPADHADRNPRRVLNVLREAANVGCYLLLIADVCGALEQGSA